MCNVYPAKVYAFEHYARATADCLSTVCVCIMLGMSVYVMRTNFADARPHKTNAWKR